MAAWGIRTSWRSCCAAARPRVLFERYVCHRPLNGVADWLTRQGLALSAGTLSNSVTRFVPLFEPLGEAILEY